MYICIHTYMVLYILYVCMYVCIYIYIYIHTQVVLIIYKLRFPGPEGDFPEVQPFALSENPEVQIIIIMILLLLLLLLIGGVWNSLVVENI